MMAAFSRRNAATAITAALEERIVLAAPSRRLRLALALEKIGRYAGQRPIRVLDAGCADGLLSLAIAKRHPNWTVVGLDLRDDLVAGASARARARGLVNAHFERADLTRPLPESGVDVLMAIECLEEIPDDRQALHMMAATLAPGGLFLIQVPERQWKPILPGSATIWRDEVRHGYSADEIVTALGDIGLERVEVQPTFRATAVVAQEIQDRLKRAPLALRVLAFPFMAVAVRFERWGLTGGRANALLAVGRRPPEPQPLDVGNGTI